MVRVPLDRWRTG